MVLCAYSLLFSHPLNAQGARQLDIDPAQMHTATAVIYEIRIPTIAATTVISYDLETGDILVPVASLMDLFKLSYEVDYEALQLKVADSKLPIVGRVQLKDPDSVYVFLSAVARNLGIIVNVNRSEAFITVTAAESLPVVKLAAREKARKLLKRPLDEFEIYESTINAMLITPSSGFGSLAIDYHFSQHKGKSVNYNSYSIGAATPLLQGTLISRTSGMGTEARTDLSWVRAWPLDAEPTQFRLGSISSTGLGAVPIYGMSISNSPFTRPQGFNVMNVTGVLPPDWSLEAYRDGMLIGYDSVGNGGQYELPVPINYGENSLKLVAYGPRGETMSFIQIIRARPGMLPKGTFEFAGSTGACARGMCSWMMNTDLRYGVSPRWTVNAGANEYSWRDESPTSVHPYASVEAITPGLSVNAGVLKDGYVYGGFAYDPSSQLSVMADYYKFSNSNAGALISGGLKDQGWATIRYSPSWLSVPIELQGVRTSTALATNTFLRLGTTLHVNQATIRPYLRGVYTSGLTSNSYMGIDAVAMAASIGLPRLSRWWLRGNIEASTKGRFEHVELVVSRTGNNGFSAEAGVTYNRLYREPRITLGFNRDFGGVRVHSSSNTGLSGELASLQSAVSGAIRWNNSAKTITTSPVSSLDQSGVSGILFVDANGNNRLDTDEERIANAIVNIDGRTAKTDNKGYFEIWGLSGGKISKVEIEPSSLESPWWVPVVSKAYVPVSPNRSMPINIPFTIGGILEGEIRSEDGGYPRTVKVRHIGTRRIYNLEPFSDGTYYQMGLLPGEYEVMLENVSPARFTVKGGESNTVLFTIQQI